MTWHVNTTSSLLVKEIGICKPHLISNASNCFSSEGPLHMIDTNTSWLTNSHLPLSLDIYLPGQSMR